MYVKHEYGSRFDKDVEQAFIKFAIDIIVGSKPNERVNVGAYDEWFELKNGRMNFVARDDVAYKIYALFSEESGFALDHKKNTREAYYVMDDVKKSGRIRTFKKQLKEKLLLGKVANMDPSPELNRGEDCNDTILDIEKIAECALKMGDRDSLYGAMETIKYLCGKTQTDEVE